MYSDPGHGWFKVPIKVLKELGIEDKITYFSHMRGTDAFLEEDLDAGVLLQALKDRNVSVKIKEFHTDRTSKIRGYSSYKAI